MQYFLPGIAAEDVLDYTFDFGTWMVAGDSITSATVTGSPAGLTISDALISGDNIVVWISDAVSETSYTLTCQIVTAQGRTAGRSAVLNCSTL